MMSSPQFIVNHRPFRTAVIIAAWISMGLFSELTGPTLPYLKYRIQGNYETIARPLAARSVGFLTGALLGGFLCAKIMKFADGILAVDLTLAAIVTAVAPFTRHWMTLALCFAGDGLSKGIIAVAGSMVILQMWGDRATVPNISLHFAFGVGALISPQLVRPFIPYRSDITGANNPNNNNTATAVLPKIAAESTTQVIQKTTVAGTDSPFIDAFIEYPYVIVAVLTFVNAVIFVVCQLVDPPKIKENRKQQQQPYQQSQNKNWLTFFNQFHPNSCFGLMGSSMIAFSLALSYLFIGLLTTGLERAYGKFLFSYAVESPAGFTPHMATLLDSAFWASFTAGRGLATGVAYFVRPCTVIGFCAILNVASIISLALFGSVHPLMTWIGSGVFGASMSPLFPVAMSWMNSAVGFSSTAASISFIANAMGAFLFSWLAGYLFQYKGPDWLMYLLATASALCLLAVILMTSLISKVKKYQKVNKNEHDETKGKLPPEVMEPLSDCKKDNECV